MVFWMHETCIPNTIMPEDLHGQNPEMTTIRKQMGHSLWKLQVRYIASILWQWYIKIMWWTASRCAMKIH